MNYERRPMNFKNTTRIFLRFLWELPQNLLGLVVWLAVRKRILTRETVRGRILFQVTGFGVSLGSFIFWSEMDRAADARTDNRDHEIGHSIQSALFGPFYLILVGIPSVSRFLYGRMVFRRRGIRWQGYFDGYPENWADRLGERIAPGGNRVKETSGRRGTA
jgi:hypothetical protein